MDTVLSIAEAHSGNEIATLTDDQNVLRTAKVNEVLSIDKCGVVEVVNRLQSQQVLPTRWGFKTKTGRIIQSETCGTRV